MARVIVHDLYPEAHVAVKNNRVKTINDKDVYLKDGSNFELELYNPLDIKVKIEIWLNGKKQRDDLVLSAGQRYFLDRFVDDKKKFKFNTFEVDDNETVKDIIKNHGLIEVKFYKAIERTLSVSDWNFYGNSTTGNPNINPAWTSSTTRGVDFIDTTLTADSTALYSSTFDSANIKKSLLTDAKIETGRIEKGKKSKQKFTTSYENFHTDVLVKYEYQLLPISQKPVTMIFENPPYIDTKKIREYCGECGRRVKKGQNYCPSCGTKN